MKQQQPPPPHSESAEHDFAAEHADPTSKPINPSPTSPLEGLDPDHGGWGVYKRPPPWERLKGWLKKL